jgi:LacI family transcriptional regulator/LacI family repressor for deo operon, udp, cdd, tsx, nupC, and nupG
MGWLSLADMESRRITQNDVARAVGVSRVTVSLAFKSHPGIPQATRERILKAAKKIGYMPDPMLSALAAYRNRLRPASYQGTLGWLVKSSRDFDWETIITYKNYFEGAQQRALRHGYKLEVFDLGKRGMSPEKLAGILKARNVPGLLLCPQPVPNAEMQFPFENFSVVTFGYTLTRPELHTVTATQYRAMVLTMKQLQARGYKRIGFALTPSHDLRTDHNYLAGYLLETYLAGENLGTMPPFEASSSDSSLDKFRAWLTVHRPDAIIIGEMRLMDWLKELGIRVPKDLGVACPALPHDKENGAIAGVFENTVHTGETAVDLLVLLIQQGERGVPDVPHRMHVEGRWVEGRSLRSL